MARLRAFLARLSVTGAEAGWVRGVAAVVARDEAATAAVSCRGGGMAAADTELEVKLLGVSDRLLCPTTSNLATRGSTGFKAAGTGLFGPSAEKLLVLKDKLRSGFLASTLFGLPVRVRCWFSCQECLC